MSTGDFKYTSPQWADLAYKGGVQVNEDVNAKKKTTKIFKATQKNKQLSLKIKSKRNQQNPLKGLTLKNLFKIDAINYMHRRTLWVVGRVKKTLMQNKKRIF